MLKVWDDGDNRDAKRPDSVTLHLLADGVAAVYADETHTLVPAVVLNESNNWTGMVLGVPIYRNYVPITYMWREVNVATGYTVSTRSIRTARRLSIHGQKKP